MIQRQPNSTDAIAALNFEPHVEGGYYRRHSDILDYFHRGDAIEYNLIHAYGSCFSWPAISDARTGQDLESITIAGRLEWFWLDQRSCITGV